MLIPLKNIAPWCQPQVLLREGVSVVDLWGEVVKYILGSSSVKQRIDFNLCVLLSSLTLGQGKPWLISLLAVLCYHLGLLNIFASCH